jgi:N-acetylmuramic acid 6-phosphate etherase
MSADEIVDLMNQEEYAALRALDNAKSAIAVAAGRAAEAFRCGARVIYLGAGTSGRVASADAAEMPPTFGIDADRFIALVAGGNAAASVAKEDAEDDPFAAITALNHLRLTSADIVIGIAASGSTPFVLSGIRHASQKGVWTCGIANNRNAPLLEIADHAIFLDTGPEVLTGSTRLKAGTSQKLTLNRISTAAMVLNGKVIENLMVDVKAKNAKLRDRCARILCDLAPLTRDEAVDLLQAHDWNIRAAHAVAAKNVVVTKVKA